jgi:hypothetical protein
MGYRPLLAVKIKYLLSLSLHSYCDVREYDTRGPRKPVIATKIFDNSEDRYQLRELYLSKILQS